MSPEKAREILELSDDSDKMEIRKQYRRLMRKYHPDVVGEKGEKHLRKVQYLIDAYHVLRNGEAEDTKKSDGKYRWRWTGEWNRQAFCERKIYLYYSMEAEETLYYEAAEGKYMWNPEEEEFPLFLISIRHAARSLAERVEAGCRMYGENPGRGERRFRTEARLVHLLAQQFTDPLEVLHRTDTPETTDERGREIYHFRAWIGLIGAKTPARGEHLYPKGFHRNRILVMDSEGETLGHLSFDEDYLYFCVIPLLKQKCAQIQMRVRGAKTAGKVDVDFYFRLEKEKHGSRNGELNEEIQSVLDEYEKEIRNTRK